MPEPHEPQAIGPPFRALQGIFKPRLACRRPINIYKLARHRESGSDAVRTNFIDFPVGGGKASGCSPQGFEMF